ncbi:MAG: hypothetical protein FWG51_04770, partial [Firmicutes bacterium]|nr:hypothetical protein [Bacillota bacterium]
YEDSLSETLSSFKNTSFFTTEENWNSSHLWDFTDIWAIDPAINDGFPHLRGFYLVHAQTPIIASQPTSAEVLIDEDAVLCVVASVADGGTLSYQWYYGWSAVGSFYAVDGATSATYSADTSTATRCYYYVVVTNTNNSVDGKKIAEEKSNIVYLDISLPPPPVITTTYTITISVRNNVGGTLSPSGPLTVNSGTDTTITFTPNAGYKIDRILVNGVNMGNASTFVVENIQADTVIEVRFVEESDVKEIIIYIGIGVGGLAVLIIIIVLVLKKKGHWEGHGD